MTQSIEAPFAISMDRGGLRVLEAAVYRGPHLYSATPMIRLQLDLGVLEAWPSNRLPNFTTRLTTLLPTLVSHGCSLRRPGGFLERLRDGTWLGHVAEHVALELQTLAGAPVSRGKTRSVRGRPGVYNVLFAYQDEEVGRLAGLEALRLVESLLPEDLRGLAGLSALQRTPLSPEPFDLPSALAGLRRVWESNSLGPTTRALLAEAHRRRIPVLRLDKQSLVQLGWGRWQRRLRASITSQTSQIAVDVAGDKSMTKSLLASSGLPTPRGVVVRDADQAVREASRLTKPLVTKPLDGNHGRGVSTDLLTEADVRQGFEIALRSVKRGRSVILEEQAPGRDHRILVVDGAVVAVAERVPAQVIGDGISTIAELIDHANRDPRRGDGHSQVMTRITCDEALLARLAADGRSPTTRPDRGTVVRLRDTANLSTGGFAIDRTDEIHPDNIAIAEQAAAVVGLDVAGIDLLSPDISRSVHETGGGIVEVNAAPGLRMHLSPSEGLPRDVARPILRSLFPPGAPSRIPIIAITGTNGKSTTTRMVAHVLRRHGLNVGMTTTSGVYFNDTLLVASDASGPRSARMVLANPRVDVAVLETARGGILREGLAFPACDVGVVLNVSEDHLGLKGVETLDDLAAVKSVVTESVRRTGVSVLNADDPRTLRMARHAGGQIVYFSLRGGKDLPEFLAQHITTGAMAVLVETTSAGREAALYRNGERTAVMPVSKIPATLNGRAQFNVQNAMAAIAVCAAQDVPTAVIADALSNFSSSFEQSPGRLNIHDGHPFRVILDYAHNPRSLEALGELLTELRSEHGRLIGMVSIPGDRRDDDIRQMGEMAATIFDVVVFREAPDGRGRPAGEVTALMAAGARSAGADPARVHCVIAEDAATDFSLSLAGPGDLVVLLPTSVEAVWRQVRAFVPALRPTPDRTVPLRDLSAHA